MISSGIARMQCVFLAIAIAIPGGFAQSQPDAAPPQAQEPAASLSIFVIQGNNSINSIPLLRSVTPIVEVRDRNDFPVEGATVVFTLPEQGPGGTFLNSRSSFSTRSDARGQATAPFTVNSIPGKFQIKVTAAAGNREGEAAITQTNTSGGYIGPALPQRSWYKKWPAWAIVGGVAAGGITAWALTRSSSSPSTSITITPGAPVFH